MKGLTRVFSAVLQCAVCASAIQKASFFPTVMLSSLFPCSTFRPPHAIPCTNHMVDCSGAMLPRACRVPDARCRACEMACVGRRRADT